MNDRRIAGIICEYNPFHNGHEYQIKEIKARGYDAVVCIMSGNTVQRGEFAVTDKYTRARCALNSGADLVLELPYPFSASGAENFATAGVRLMSAAGAEAICFGSESGDADCLEKAARVCLSDSFEEEYRKLTSTEIGTAEAYYLAFERVAGFSMPSGANDILGISYMKAILKDGLSLKAEIVKRRGSDYRQSDITDESHLALPSASMIRGEMQKNGLSDLFKASMPEQAFEALKNAEITRPMDSLSECFLSFFRLCDADRLASLDILDAGGGIAEKLCKMSHKVHSYSELVKSVAGKKYPHARIRRAILHCMSGAATTDGKVQPAFSTVLGFNTVGREILSNIRRSCGIPMIAKPADASSLGESASRQSDLSSRIDAIFTLAKPQISNSSEFITKSPIIIQ